MATDQTPSSTPALQAEHAAAAAAQQAETEATKARMLHVQVEGYVDPLSMLGDATEDSATTVTTETSATDDGIDWDFLKAASKDEYAEYVEGLTPEQSKEVLRRLPVAGVRSFSQSKNDAVEATKALALKEQEYQQELQRLASQLMPAPAPAPQAGDDAAWKDPAVAVLERKIAEMEARDQQRSVAEGLGAIGSEMHKLAEEHPFFASQGAIGAQKLFAHMQALNTPNTRVAFKDLFETELDAEKEERIVAKLRGNAQHAANLPHVAPTGTARRAPTEIPRTMAGKKEQMRKLGIGERLQEFFNR